MLVHCQAILHWHMHIPWPRNKHLTKGQTFEIQERTMNHLSNKGSNLTIKINKICLCYVKPFSLITKTPMDQVYKNEFNNWNVRILLLNLLLFFFFLIENKDEIPNWPCHQLQKTLLITWMIFMLGPVITYGRLNTYWVWGCTVLGKYNNTRMLWSGYIHLPGLITMVSTGTGDFSEGHIKYLGWLGYNWTR